MLNSSNYVAQPNVLQSGNQFSSAVDMEVLKDPNTKVYKHPAHGSRFIMPDGAELIFLGGVFITNNPDIIRELDKIANKRGSQITTDDAAMQRMQQEIKQVAEDAARRASEGDVVNGLRPDGTTKAVENPEPLTPPPATDPVKPPLI